MYRYHRALKRFISLKKWKTQDPTCGGFPWHRRYATDQVPLPFVIGNDTPYDEKGAVSVSIKQPADGLEKRQATLQLCHRPVQLSSNLLRLPGETDGQLARRVRSIGPRYPDRAVQPRLGIIFRGLGMRISKTERAAYDQRVDVYFQKCAWADRLFNKAWAAKTWKRHVDEHHTTADGDIEETLHLFDRLEGQITDEFQAYMRDETASHPFYYPGGETDNLAPPDAGYGKDVKHETGREMDEWLDVEDNLERWESGKLSASDRRILMTIWAANAKARADKKHYAMWRYFERTGALISADGSGDDMITMEKLPPGVPTYVFADPELEARELAEPEEAPMRVMAASAPAAPVASSAAALAEAGESAYDARALVPAASKLTFHVPAARVHATQEAGQDAAALVPAAARAPDDEDGSDDEGSDEDEIDDLVMEDESDLDGASAVDSELTEGYSSFVRTVKESGFFAKAMAHAPVGRELRKRHVLYKEEDVGWFVALVQRQVVASKRGCEHHLFVLSFERNEQHTRKLDPVAFVKGATQGNLLDTWEYAPAGSWCLLFVPESSLI